MQTTCDASASSAAHDVATNGTANSAALRTLWKSGDDVPYPSAGAAVRGATDALV